jgi:hypothetical protein
VALCDRQKTNRRPATTAAAVLVAGLLILGSAHATSVIKFSDQGLVVISSRIIEGTVTSTHSEWNTDATQIHTIVTVDVKNVLKGPKPEGATLTLRLLGGRVGDDVMELVGAPVFQQGEEVILFFEKGAPDLMPIAGLYQGKFTITTDPTGQRRIKENGEPAATFRARIVDYIAEEEAGGQR